MKLHPLFTVQCILIAALTGCATTGSYKVSKSAPPSQVSFAVKQFTTPNYASLSEGDKGVRDFEQIVLPAQLVSALRKTPGVKEAYFTSGNTAATDVVVEGSILASDGRTLSLRILAKRVDGKTILTENISVVHADGNEALIRGKLDGLFQATAKKLTTAALGTDISLPEARVFAYSENPALSISQDMLNDAATAGEVEREDILAPLSNALLSRADIAIKNYVNWQSISTPVVIERNNAKKQQALSTFGALMGVAAGAASFSSGMDFAKQGNTYGVQMAQNTMQQSTLLAVQAVSSAEVAANQAKAASATLAAFKNEFSVGQTRQVTVRVYDKVLKLSGSQEDMLNEFRQVVKTQLNKHATESTATIVAAL